MCLVQLGGHPQGVGRDEILVGYHGRDAPADRGRQRRVEQGQGEDHCEQGSQRRQRQRRRAVGLDPADGFLERLSDPNGDLAHEWDRDHDRYVVEKLMAVVQSDFTPATWEAFRRFGVDGVLAARVAEELGLTENAVILAKARVLKRLREEAGDLLE